MKTVPETRPILIAGAGPTCLTAALELARLGGPVRIIDKLAAPSYASRALAIQARTLELLTPRGTGATMLQQGNRARGAHDGLMSQLVQHAAVDAEV